VKALGVRVPARGKVTQMIPNLEGRVRAAIRDVQKLAQGRDATSIARAREMLRRFYGGPVRVRAEEREGKRVPVAVTTIPAFALLAVAGEGRVVDCSGSGGPIWQLRATLPRKVRRSPTKRLKPVSTP
jgi:hypothetical protein